MKAQDEIKELRRKPVHRNGATPQVNFDDNELWRQTLTESQFNSFKDPLASIFLLNPSSGCGIVSAICQMDLPGFTSNVQMLGGWTITPVPSPEPLFLSLAGLVGLALARRGKQLDSLLSPS